MSTTRAVVAIDALTVLESGERSSSTVPLVRQLKCKVGNYNDNIHIRE
jgi:hypothetical protein